jgi:hypothetical protein
MIINFLRFKNLVRSFGARVGFVSSALTHFTVLSLVLSATGALGSSTTSATPQDFTHSTFGVRTPTSNPPNTIDPVCHKLQDVDGLGLFNPGLKNASNVASGATPSEPAKSIH